jgi:hypothetical protein
MTPQGSVSASPTPSRMVDHSASDFRGSPDRKGSPPSTIGRSPLLARNKDLSIGSSPRKQNMSSKMLGK